MESKIQLQEEEYNEASSMEKKTRIQILMEENGTCNLKPDNNENQNQNPTMKTIQLHTPLVEYEWELSQKIRAIPHTNLYFLTMISPPTPIEIGELTEDNIEKCTKHPINKKQKQQEVEIVSTTYNRKDAIPINQYLTTLKTNHSALYFMTILDTFSQLLYAIQKIQNINDPIIMFDIHSDTILYDKKNATPIIIDHQLAVLNSDLENPEKRRELIPHYDLPYQTIPIELWILSNIKDEPFNQQKLFEWIDQYKQNTIQNTLLTTFIETYKTNLKDQKSWEQLEEELIKTSLTWDIFSISIIYYKMCSQMLDLRTKYEFLDKWFTLLENIIYSTNRPTSKDIIENMNILFTTVDKELYHTFLLETLLSSDITL
jgi:hypothetical protein